MVRLAECKGANLITSRLSYSSTAIELISALMLPKLLQKLFGIGIYHSLPNPMSSNLNSYRKMLTSLYDLIELPNYFYRIPQSIAYFLSIILIGLSLAISEMGGLKFVLGSVPVPQETDSTPAMTRPGAGPSSAMVTRP